ncbi:hypothetical protein FNW02_22215 [Komarekiella sp. 'clone 1']|uniref:Type II secretion system protein GspC N-terminal domain-containing protein n=1 Tax=Komarekiella delphini-convector SJRDD-AB1 TaxID=2593771 RepID=A0AA40VSS9_9NOST|nr:hypothetical protein [Komarekiella delphini-convector]MBD6618464.1 hypothetical protein [Komarekiella delphini-convector SJRDD-AB1]
MSQAASTHLLISEPSEDLIANEPWSIDMYADGLMDELFADIDYILDGSRNLPSQTIRQGNRPAPLPPEYMPVQTVTVPQIVLPNALNQPSQGRHKQLSTVVVGTPTVNAVSRRPQKTRRALGKLLIVGTTLGVAIASIIYLVQSGVVHLLNTKPTQSDLPASQPQAKLPTRSEIEAELVDYMLEALAVIEQQEAKNQKSVRPGFSNQETLNQTASVAPAGNLPPLLAANGIPPAPNRSGGVVERIYIPVYQAPSPMRYALPSIPGSPKLPPVATSQGSKPNVVKTALNTVQQAAKPINVNMLAAVRGELKPVAVKTAPITLRQPSNPLPALPVVPLRAAPTPEAAPTITQHQVFLPPAVADAPSDTLEGLLELGNKSAALFKIGGVTRRVDVGESIGSSGWTLVDVSNGEAVIRRNGEVRSIYAGQKF